MKIVKIALTQIQDNPFQPRDRYDGIEELAEKIAAMKAQLPETLGLIHVPNARTVDGNGAVQLAEGHRRLRAFRLLADADPDYAEMPVNLVAMPDEDMDDIAWSENYDRKALTPIEEARALKRTMESRRLTQEQLASLRHLGRSTVANKIRLLNLPDDLLEAVANGQVSERQAIDLLPALEIKPSDMDGAGLTKDLHFIPGSRYAIPTPNTLKRRVLEFGNLTGDQIRMTVEQIKKKVEEAKLARWQRENPPAKAEAPVSAPAGNMSSTIAPVETPAVIAPPPPPVRQTPPPPPVRAQTTDEEPEPERDWLEPAVEEPDAPDEAEEPEAPEEIEETEETGTPEEQAGDEEEDDKEDDPAGEAVNLPAPPPPPASKPQPKPVMWQITISIKQKGDVVEPGSSVIISLFKDSELVKSLPITCAQIQTTLSNMLIDELPGGVRFNFNE